MTAIAILHRDEIIAQVRQGAYLSAIAESLGVTDAAISQHLAKDPEYIAARESGMEFRLDAGLRAIEQAGDDLNLARCREIRLKRLEWRAEREFGRWSAKSQVIALVATVSLDSLLSGSARGVLDAIEVIPDPVSSPTEAGK